MSDELLKWTMLVSLALLLLAAVAALYRMVRGPLLTDRVVALDLVGMLLTGSMLISAAYWRQTVFLDATIVFAMVGFLATVGISRYLERKGGNQ